jgi:sugar (pentulose or hexulose) kinase
MVTTLAIDVGSSSVKAGVLLGATPVGVIAREPFATQYDASPQGGAGARSEVRADDVLRAVSRAARAAVRSAVGKPVDVVALSCMSPSWVAIDKWGDALTPIITHQDRRAIQEARDIERGAGRRQVLAVTGNRPVPGGISSTTAAWFARHEKDVMRRARFVGHLQTLLLARWTGVAAMDPGNASFTGLWRTCENRIPTDGSTNWEPGLLDLVGLRADQMPRVLPGDAVVGSASPAAARELGVRSGTPILTGVIDTSAAFILAGARPGMLVNASGSTDALGVILDAPAPSPQYLTRALGVGENWVAIATLPAAGSALIWARATLFADLTDKNFFALARQLGDELSALPRRRAHQSHARGARDPSPADDTAPVSFDLDLAGSRVSVEQPTGAFRNLRLSTTREEMLAAVISALADRSAERVDWLRQAAGKLRREVLRTGGTSALLADVLYARWPGRWQFADVPEATLLGVGQMAAGHPC